MTEILMAAIANLMTRYLPFIFLKRYYTRLLYLNREFPLVLLVVLTLYMFYAQDASSQILLYKICAILITILIHLIFRRSLLSIFIGSVIYIAIVNSFTILPET